MNLLLTAHYLIVLTVALVLSSSMEDYDDPLVGPPPPPPPPDCEVEFEKVGCFRDRYGSRALSELIFHERHDIDWEPGKWELFLKKLACRCAKESDYNGYSYFGLQFYAECWSGPEAANRFDMYGKSMECVGAYYKKCDDSDKRECVGKGLLNYVYRIVPKAGGSGMGPLPP